MLMPTHEKKKKVYCTVTLLEMNVSVGAKTAQHPGKLSNSSGFIVMAKDVVKSDIILIL